MFGIQTFASLKVKKHETLANMTLAKVGFLLICNTLKVKQTEETEYFEFIILKIHFSSFTLDLYSVAAGFNT